MPSKKLFIKSKYKTPKIAMWTILFSMIAIIVCMMLLPTPKDTTMTHVIGSPLSKQASVYLNNVLDTEDVSIDETQLDVSEETSKKITITYKGINYFIPFKMMLPNIADVIHVKSYPLDFLQGGNYNDLFNIDEAYRDKINYSIPADKLEVGEHTVEMTLYNQKITQVLHVREANSQIGKLQQYDYKNLSLTEVVSAYLKEANIDSSKVAFSYKNTSSDLVVHMNENQMMVAASTYKLPLAMFVEDSMASKNLTLSSKLTVVKSASVDNAEYNQFVKGYGSQVSIDNLLQATLEWSSNTAAVTLMNHFGGANQLYTTEFLKYGANEQTTYKALNPNDNSTTSGYYLQVLDYLWKNKTNYPTVTRFLEKATPNEYYEQYVQDVNVWHKYGVYNGRINDVAVVFTNKPYLIALYTNGITERQFGSLAYIIYKWHIVNQD